MKTSDFDYNLPPERIAQKPVEPRDHSRLMVLNREDGSIEHQRLFDITKYLKINWNMAQYLLASIYDQRQPF